MSKELKKEERKKVSGGANAKQVRIQTHYKIVEDDFDEGIIDCHGIVHAVIMAKKEMKGKIIGREGRN